MKTKKAPYYALSALTLALIGCGGGGGGGDGSGAGTSKAPADINSVVYSHKSWEELSPPQEPAKEFVGTSEPFTEIIDIDEYSCTNDKYSLTENPEEFITIQPDASVVWLGNLIQGRSHLQVGSLEELSIRERAPMEISIDLLRNDNYRHIEQPSLATVNSAIGELVENAVHAGHRASSDVVYDAKEAHSSTQTSFDLGISAEYLGSQAEARLSIDKQANEHTYFGYFIQKAFTVSMELPVGPHDVVTDDFSDEQLQSLQERGHIADDNPPLYISNITYGRVLIYKMTSTHAKERVRAAIYASYEGLKGGGSGYLDTELEETLNEAKIEIAAFGGEQKNIETLIRTGKLSEYFTGDTQLTSMRPISFEVRRLSDNIRADIVRTTEYDVKSCEFERKTVKPIGEKIKVIFDKVKVPHDCDAGVDKGDLYGRFDVIYTDANTGGEVTRRVVTVPKTKSVASGNSFNLPGPKTPNAGVVNKYYGKTLRISAQLMDQDGGANGADDIVGNWNANQFSIAGRGPGTHTKKAVSNCSGKSSQNPTLTYRIERLDYIYP